MTDKEIVDLYWDRNEDAIKYTKQVHGKLIRTVAYNVLFNNDDCDEAENDTYMAAWNSMPTQRPEVLSTYLGHIVRQIAISMYRKTHAQKRSGSEYALSIDELDEAIPSGTCVEEECESEFDSNELKAIINAFVKGLDEKSRNIFICRYFYFDSVKKIADYCDMNEATVKSALFRMREKLREYLEKEGRSI